MTVKQIRAKKELMPFWAVQRLVRADGRIEYVCKHGVGHPIYETGINAVHGCDGCCSEKDSDKKMKSEEPAKRKFDWLRLFLLLLLVFAVVNIITSIG